MSCKRERERERERGQRKAVEEESMCENKRPSRVGLRFSVIICLYVREDPCETHLLDQVFEQPNTCSDR
jgi:hypothetical protein